MQFLAGLETHRFSWSDAYFGSGAGIATDSGFASANAEDAESAQFDTLTRSQRLFQAFEDRIDGGFSLCARQTGALDYVMDDVLFNQWGNLADATVMTLLLLQDRCYRFWLEYGTPEWLYGHFSPEENPKKRFWPIRRPFGPI